MASSSTVLAALLALAAPLAAGLLAAGCAPAPTSAGARGGAGGVGEDEAADADAEVRAGEAAPVGVVVIDTQRVFFEVAGEENPSVDVDGLVRRIGRAFTLAHENGRPLVITYEASTRGEHALAPALAAVVPPSAAHIVKTTFAATGQPKFVSALAASGVKRVVTFGAETDVCVLQTILGMRERGYEVIAVTDGQFTEEVNDGPARRRMRQAGVVAMTMAEAERVIAEEAPSPPPSPGAVPVILRPLETGFVLHDVGAVGGADANANAKRARLRELLLLGEWLERPVFAADPAAATAALPADLRALLKRPIQRLADRPAAVTQVVVAGGRAGLAALVEDQAARGDVQLVEDALFGSDDLEPFYAARRAIPTTYKSLYYELTVSVDDAEWPSPRWVANGAIYYDMTKAPESLPPLRLR